MLKVSPKRWMLGPADAGVIALLQRELNISELLARLLCRRGLCDPAVAHQFLQPSLGALHDPMLMRDMRPAVERIRQAVAQQQRILIYGDYDVDGVTATIILKKALEMIGAQVDYYIPERLVDGYGMREDAIERARDDGYQLVISVDTGIRAQKVVEVARRIGLDVIITDHHLPEEGLPQAIAVLNPNRPDCDYPEKNLAGVGVAFKLVQALLDAVEYPNRTNALRSFLKIVAIGTVADMVPLVGENRIIARFGLEGLLTPNNPGLSALLDVVGLKGKTKITSGDVGFRIGPRINAVGRMAGASAAVELFSARTEDEARQIASEMDAQNGERQRVMAEIIEQTMKLLEHDPQHTSGHVAVLAAEGWHRGVIGLAASRVVEKIHRPTLVIAIENGVGHGSGRSIKSFHLLDGLTACAELFDKFGGHSHAAGVTIKADRIDELRRRLNAHAAQILRDEDLVPQLEIDAQVPISSVTLDFINEVELLEPFGQGNPEPVFLTKNAMVVGEPRVLKEKHLKLRLMEHGRAVDALWWNVGNLDAVYPGDQVQVAYTISQNTYNGRTTPQLTIQDLKTGG